MEAPVVRFQSPVRILIALLVVCTPSAAAEPFITCPNRIDPFAKKQTGPPIPMPIAVGAGVPHVTVALNGRFVAFTYETEAGKQTEIWDVPPPQRSWLLIVLSSLAVSGLAVGWQTYRRRRSQNPSSSPSNRLSTSSGAGS
jgi:hypothetical protein